LAVTEDAAIGWVYLFVAKELEPMHGLVGDPVALWPVRKRLLLRNRQWRQGWDNQAHLYSAVIAIDRIVEKIYRYGATIN
jgi:hypothetical protein